MEAVTQQYLNSLSLMYHKAWAPLGVKHSQTFDLEMVSSQSLRSRQLSFKFL